MHENVKNGYGKFDHEGTLRGPKIDVFRAFEKRAPGP